MSADPTGGDGLRITDLGVRYGAREVLAGVSLTVPPGRIVGLIGPNGAGKTTLIDAVSGFVPATGSITLDGVALGALPAHRRARFGLRRTWQSLELFEDLTVAENLGVAVTARGPVRAPDVDAGDLGLDPDVLPRTLDHGDRGLLGLGRALAGAPKVLLLDEPAAGLDTEERHRLADRLHRLAEPGLGILLVDHDMGLVLSVCDEVAVLDQGRLIALGPPQEIRADRSVREAYLGAGAGAPRTRRPAPAGEAGGRAAPVLEARAVTAGYGGGPVVRDVSLQVAPGELVALLGPNGAGKTTLLRALARLLPMQHGEVRLAGRALPRRPEAAARRGLGLVPSGGGVFGRLSVKENLRLAARVRPSARGDVLDLFPALRPRLDAPAQTLSGGEGQQLLVARALLRKPKVLLVDEPSTGLAPAVVEDLLAALRRLADAGETAVLLVEQAVAQALAVADRAYVLDRGSITVEGSAARLAEQTELVESAYLGRPG